MNTIIVKNQKEIDNLPIADVMTRVKIRFGTFKEPAILRDEINYIYFISRNGVAESNGNSIVYAYDKSTVYAYDTSEIHSYSDSVIVVYDNSIVYADEFSNIDANDNSIIHKLSDSVHIELHDNSKMGEI